VPEAVPEMNPTAQKHFRWNFLMGLLNGIAFQVAETMIDSSLVLPWLISQLTHSNFLIGLSGPIRNAGWFLPQLLVSGDVQRRERKLVIYQVFAVVRGLSFGLLTLATWLLGSGHPAWLLALFFLFLTIMSLGEGISGISFLDIVAKCIPARTRGSYFAWRSFIGGILALGSGLWVRYILSARNGLAFPTNFGILFTTAFVGILVGLISFSLVIEPIEPAHAQAVPLWKQLQRAWEYVRSDHNFARLIWMRVFLVLGSSLAAPFYIVYAKNKLDAPASNVGSYLMVLTLASIASNLLWGRLCDRRGNRLVVLIAGTIGMGVPVTVLLAGYLHSLTLVFLPLVLQGIYQGSIMISQVNFVLEIAPPTERPIYIGLVNTVLGIVTVALSLGGVIVDIAGYHALFWLAALCFLPGLWAAWRMRDPRVA
jgi:MFS family permease